MIQFHENHRKRLKMFINSTEMFINSIISYANNIFIYTIYNTIYEFIFLCLLKTTYGIHQYTFNKMKMIEKIL
jgi:hypothetical protein